MNTLDRYRTIVAIRGKYCSQHDVRVKLGQGRWDLLLLIFLAHVYDISQSPDGAETGELKVTTKDEMDVR